MSHNPSSSLLLQSVQTLPWSALYQKDNLHRIRLQNSERFIDENYLQLSKLLGKMLLVLSSAQHFQSAAAQLCMASSTHSCRWHWAGSTHQSPQSQNKNEAALVSNLIVTWFQRSFPYFICLSWSLAYWRGKANLTTVGRPSFSQFPVLVFFSPAVWHDMFGKGFPELRV